jgi:hypothetical protein
VSKKITKITPEQAALFPEWVKRYVEIGLSTEPADFERATEAALKAYKLCNLDKPVVVLRMGSPYAATLGGILAWGMLRAMKDKKVWDQVGGQVWDQVRSQVGDQVGGQVWDQVSNQVRSQVRSQVGGQVWDQVSNQVWDQVGGQVGGQVRSQVWDQVGGQVRSQVWDQVGDRVRSGIYNDRGGAFWASWVGYVGFMRDVLGWNDPVLEHFEIDEALTGSCGWVWWHENVLAISDRPSAIHRDGQGRLHNEVGPSIVYRDGWSLWHWHGVSVPSEWIENRASLTAQIALGQQNVERRRAACEIVGWEKILTELKAETIDKDEDQTVGELIEVNLPDSGKERFLRVVCGTGRRFAIPVPREMKTALAANAWTYAVDEVVIRSLGART